MAHSRATSRYLRTAGVPTTYGFGLPGACAASRGRLTFDPSQSVWFDRMMSAPAWRVMSSNRRADCTCASRDARSALRPVPPHSAARWGFPLSRHGDEHGERARRVAGCHVERDRRVAERECLAVGRDHVAGRLGAAEPIDDLPVRRRHDDARLVALLQELRAAVMVGMRMGDDGVADRGWIEPQRLQPAGHLVLDRVVEERVDQDDPLRRRHRPRGVLAICPTK